VDATKGIGKGKKHLVRYDFTEGCSMSFASAITGKKTGFP
jgi:hypothetical protein